MSSTTWTPRAVASEARSWRAEPWRAVESQHRVSTVPLVDSLEEQMLLEQLIETSKPPIPEDAIRLDYLLATPFRYPPMPGGSRFRSTIDPGVFHAAIAMRTACAEAGHWRWRFLMDSPALAQIGPMPQTVFQTRVASEAMIDLRHKPFSTNKKAWMDPADYSHCQAFARTARDAGVDAIVYASVRDPDHDTCVVLLSPTAFAARKPVAKKDWLLTVTRKRIFWVEQSGTGTFEFDPTESVATRGVGELARRSSNKAK